MATRSKRDLSSMFGAFLALCFIGFLLFLMVALVHFTLKAW